MSSHHEAGHVVLSILALIHPLKVSIFGKGYIAGETVTSVPTFPSSGLKPRGPELFLLHGRLRMFLAGHASEKRFFETLVGEKVPRSLRLTAKNDFEAYRAIVRKRYAKSDARLRLRKRLDRETDQLVKEHWVVISAVAKSIAQFKQLDYHGIKQAILGSKHQVRFWKKMFRHLEDLIRIKKDRR
jgi:hypothetical protein